MRTLKLSLPLLALLLPAFAFAGSQTYSTPGTYTFTVPNYTGTLTVTATGGGGGGGGGAMGGDNWPGSSGSKAGDVSFGPIVAQGGLGGCGGGVTDPFSYMYDASRKTATPASQLDCSSTEGKFIGGARTFTGTGDGTASGGDTNILGGGAAGGGGGRGAQDPVGWGGAGINSSHGSPGANGGRSVKSYTVSQLAPGTTVTVTIGTGRQGIGVVGTRKDYASFNGGAGGINGCADPSQSGALGGCGGTYASAPGEDGQDGSVTIQWTDATVTTNTCPNGSPAPNNNTSECTCEQGNTSQCPATQTCPNGSVIAISATCPVTTTSCNNGDITTLKAKIASASNAFYATNQSGWDAPTNTFPPTTQLEQLEMLYIGYLDRSGDVGGMNYWKGRMNAGMSWTAIAQSFGVQTETRAKYPFLVAPSAAGAGAFVENLFQNIFDRASDTSGKTYWTNELTGDINSGDTSAINQFILTFELGALNACTDTDTDTDTDNTCPNGSPAPNNNTSECTCEQGNTSQCPAQSRPTCSIWFDPPVLTGVSTTMHWSSTGLTGQTDTFLLNGTGYVGASGQAQVFLPGDYSAVVSGQNGTNSCAAVLTRNNICVPSGANHCVGNVVTNSCNTAVRDCALTNQRCVNGQCVVIDDCRNVCSNGYIVNNCTGDRVRSCTYGCSGNSCNPTPAPNVVSWTVYPVLLRSGSTASVNWDVRNVSSCSVTGTNGDGTSDSATGLWGLVSGRTSAGAKTSSPITGQTVFTLSCAGLAGAIPSGVSRSTTVNIVPVVSEP